jgi:hypothetical protein
MKIKGLLDPRLRGDDNKASFRMRTSYRAPISAYPPAFLPNDA